MKYLIFGVLLVVAVAVYADIGGSFDGTVYEPELSYYKRQRGSRSDGKDDSPSEARCGNFYQIGNCSCSPRQNCDGALVQTDKDGLKCVAYNKANRAFGVDAFAHCLRLMISVESETTTDPVAGCPENYKVVSCMLHSYDQHQHPTCSAVKKSGKCVVTGKGCPKGACTECRMQARCIRYRDWFAGQDEGMYKRESQMDEDSENIQSERDGQGKRSSETGTFEAQQMALIIPGRPDYTWELNDDETYYPESVELKEGVEYTQEIRFYVGGADVIPGIRVHNAVTRKGISVDKQTYMVGSYSPRTEAYIFTTPKDAAPKGIMARGEYQVKSKILDDDRNVLRAWTWRFNIVKEWQ